MGVLLTYTIIMFWNSVHKWLHLPKQDISFHKITLQNKQKDYS